MPFVDLSSPTQNLQGNVATNSVQPVQPTAVNNQTTNQQTSRPAVQQTTADNSSPAGISRSADQQATAVNSSPADQPTIVNMLSSDQNNSTPVVNMEEKSEPQNATSEPEVKINAGPEFQTVPMPSTVNNQGTSNNNQVKEQDTNPNNQNNIQEITNNDPVSGVQSPVGGQSLPGIGNLPKLDEVIPPTNNNQDTNPNNQIADQQSGSPAVQQTTAVNSSSADQQISGSTQQPTSGPADQLINSNIKPIDTGSVPGGSTNTAPAEVTANSAANFKYDVKSFNPRTADFEEFMSYTIGMDASDLHISAENQSMIRVHGSLQDILGDLPTNQRIEELVKQITSPEQFESLQKTRELDISYQHKSGNRFRVNVFMTKGKWGIALRLIPQKIRSIAELKLPEICYDLTKIPQGLIILAGPTGSGKSTSLAAMLQEINVTRAEHILTIEDPIEYVYPRGKSRVDQRELGKDTMSWKNALRAALRQDPNVVLVGEMRDYETIEATVTVAETGHLVFATLHTNSAAQTIDRIIDVFPEGQQEQIRAQLANVLAAVISQRLIPVKSGGRKAVQEVLITTTAVKNSIREGKTYQIDNIIQTSSESGMQTLESDLVKLVRAGELTVQQAEEYSVKVEELHSLLKSNK